MKKAHLLFAALFLIVANAVHAGEKRTLYVYTWEDYFSQAEVEAFEREYDCRVDFDYYDSNETMLAKLAEGGGYDVITPSPDIAQTLFTMRRLHPLDHGLLPNLGNIDSDSSSLTQDPTMRYSVPYTATVTGIGYNRDMVPPDAVGSWAIFADKRIGKRMTLLNDVRETLGAALKFLGYSINTVDPEEIAAAGKVVREWKRNIVLFDVEQAKQGLKDGTYAAIQAYSGDVAQIMTANPAVEFVVPEEGAGINADVFVVASDCEDRELAHAFINHFLDATVARNTMLDIRYYLPNKAARELMDDETLRHIGFNLSPEVRKKCESIVNVGAVRSMYDRVWEDVLLDD